MHCRKARNIYSTTTFPSLWASQVKRCSKFSFFSQKEIHVCISNHRKSETRRPLKRYISFTTVIRLVFATKRKKKIQDQKIEYHSEKMSPSAQWLGGLYSGDPIGWLFVIHGRLNRMIVKKVKQDERRSFFFLSLEKKKT